MKKWKTQVVAYLWYTAAILTAMLALLMSSGIETAATGWAMLGWGAVSLVLLMAVLVMAALGCCAEQGSSRKAHRAPSRTVKAGKRKAG